MALRAGVPRGPRAPTAGRELARGAAKLRGLALVATAGRPPSFSHLSMLSSMERVSCVAAGADIGSSPHSAPERTPTSRVVLAQGMSTPEMSGFGARDAGLTPWTPGVAQATVNP
jgi:hypothetical protein